MYYNIQFYIPEKYSTSHFLNLIEQELLSIKTIFGSFHNNSNQTPTFNNVICLINKHHNNITQIEILDTEGGKKLKNLVSNNIPLYGIINTPFNFSFFNIATEIPKNYIPMNINQLRINKIKRILNIS